MQLKISGLIAISIISTTALAATEVETYKNAGWCAGGVTQAMKSGAPINDLRTSAKGYLRVTAGEFSGIMDEAELIFQKCNSSNSAKTWTSLQAKNAAFDACVMSSFPDKRRANYAKGFLDAKIKIMNTPKDSLSMIANIMCSSFN
jgi:hypothetical protein